MTYRPHTLLSFGGRLFTEESWNCGLRIVLGDPEDSTVSLQSYETWSAENLDDIAADVAAWFTSSGAKISSAARLDWVKLNAINADGRYVSESETNIFEWAAGDAPAGTVSPAEAQVTMVVSLLTNATRGRASRGRFYPPTGEMGVSPTTGRVSATLCQQMADAAKVLLDNIANEPGIDLSAPRVVVASDLGSPGPARSVQRVAVGNVPDTQRRRRSSLPEAYSVSADIVIG